MEQFAEDLQFAKSALSQLFSSELSDKFENLVNEGEYYSEEIIDDIPDQDESNIIVGLEITDPKQLKLFSDLIIQIFKDHNYNINKYINHTNNNTTDNSNDYKYIKDMNINEFTQLIHSESLTININTIDKNTLENILSNNNYNGHKFYSTVNEPKHQFKFVKLLKKSNVSLGKGKEIYQRIKQRSQRELEMINDSANEMTNDSDSEPENHMENEPENNRECKPIIKQLIEMNLNEFINALINEATTNDTIQPKLGDKFNMETCKKTFIDNEMTVNKFHSVGKKEFSKICKLATIRAGPANKLYKILYDKVKKQMEEMDDINIENENKSNDIPIISTDTNVSVASETDMSDMNKSEPENIPSDEAKNIIENEGKDESNESVEDEMVDLKDKHCVDMTQNEFISVILDAFQEKVKDFNDINRVKDILLSNEVNYASFMSMKIKGFNKLVKDEFNLKGAQCVGIYKLVTKRIERERQESFVPLMEKQISTISETHPTLLDRTQTQKVLQFLEKNKEIDQKFVRDSSNRMVFEKKLIAKVPSIKTGDAIVIYNKLHELVEEKEEDENDEMDTESEERTGLHGYIAKLDEIQMSKMAKMVMEQSLKKLFEQINNKICNNNVNGMTFVSNLNGKNENEFMKFFGEYIHNKCFEFSSDLYLMIANNDNRIEKIKKMTCEQLSKYIIDTFIQKIGELIVNEAMDGLRYLELGKMGVCKKLNKYLPFGVARKLVSNIELNLDGTYKYTKRNSSRIGTPISVSMPSVNDNILNYNKISVGVLSVKKQRITPVSTPSVSISVSTPTPLDKKLINNSKHSPRVSKEKLNRLTPRQSLSEKTDVFEAIIEEEEANDKFDEQSMSNFQYNTPYNSHGIDSYNNKLNGQNHSSNNSYLQNYEKEESKSMYSQTLGLSETSRIYSRVSILSNNIEEKELATIAIDVYKNKNKNSLKECKKRVYKCDLNKLFPHININVNREPKRSVSWNYDPIANNEKDVMDEYNNMKGRNLNGKEFYFTSFKYMASKIYKISDKENTFYRTLYDDVKKEKNGFLNILTRYEIQEWLAGYECNRIKYVIYTKHIDIKTFRCVSKDKFMNNINYLGFLPMKRRKKIYDALVKYIKSKNNNNK